jgi:hypothetical protein
VNLRPILLIASMLLTICGCQSSDAELARQAMSSQAAQNEAMAKLHHEVAVGARELTAADANSRRQSIMLQQQIQTERSELSSGWNDLHSQRRSDVLSLRTDSFLSALVRGGGATAAALLALAIVRSVLNARGDADAELTSLVLDMCQTSEHSPIRAACVQPPALPTAMPLLSKTQGKQ